jgi:hypothetical protein
LLGVSLGLAGGGLTMRSGLGLVTVGAADGSATAGLELAALPAAGWPLVHPVATSASSTGSAAARWRPVTASG